MLNIIFIYPKLNQQSFARLKRLKFLIAIQIETISKSSIIALPNIPIYFCNHNNLLAYTAFCACWKPMLSQS